MRRQHLPYKNKAMVCLFKKNSYFSYPLLCATDEWLLICGGNEKTQKICCQARLVRPQFQSVQQKHERKDKTPKYEENKSQKAKSIQENTLLWVLIVHATDKLVTDL